MIDQRFKLDQRTIRVVRKSVRETVTQSEMMLRASCARKWFYRYGLRLAKLGVIDYNLVYGSMMHELLAKHYRGDQTLDDGMEIEWTPPEDALLTTLDRDEIEIIREKVYIAFNAYEMHYRKLDSRIAVMMVEKPLELEWQGLKLAGVADMIARPDPRDGIFIWDFKTAGRLDATILDAWSFRFQFLFYCWLYWKIYGKKPSGTMVNGLVKCQLRPKIADKRSKRKESQEEYLYRVKGEMTVNREKYFYRQRMPLSTGALERFELDILEPHVNSFKAIGETLDVKLLKSLVMAMNTNQCHLYNSYCEYLHLCKDGPLALGEFQTREVKHQELEDTNYE